MAYNDGKLNLIKFTTANSYAGHAALSCAGMRLHSFKNPTEFRNEKGSQLIFDELPLPHKNLEVFVAPLKRVKQR